jgi:hypothetical protein
MPTYKQAPWPNFHRNGTTYRLNHLNEYTIQVTDSDGVERLMLVHFSDHCFTRDASRDPSQDDPTLLYRPSTRRPNGYFCLDRWGLSRDLRTHIHDAVHGQVWMCHDPKYCIVPTVVLEGQPLLYGILCKLSKEKGYHFKLSLEVITAYPWTRLDGQGQIIKVTTYGKVDFSRLINLQVNNQTPTRITDGNRKTPELQIPDVQ